MAATRLTCQCCNGPLLPGTTAVLLQSVRVLDLEEDKSYQLLLNEREKDGEVYTWSSFVCHDCFDLGVSEVVTMFSDEPITDDVPLVTCTLCDRAIQDGETLTVVRPIEMLQTDPGRKGKGGGEYVILDDEDGLACLRCNNELARILELSSLEEMSEDGECSSCTHRACWRHGPCDCYCHRAVRWGSDR